MSYINNTLSMGERAILNGDYYTCFFDGYDIYTSDVEFAVWQLKAPSGRAMLIVGMYVDPPDSAAWATIGISSDLSISWPGTGANVTPSEITTFKHAHEQHIYDSWMFNPLLGSMKECPASIYGGYEHSVVGLDWEDFESAIYLPILTFGSSAHMHPNWPSTDTGLAMSQTYQILELPFSASSLTPDNTITELEMSKRLAGVAGSITDAIVIPPGKFFTYAAGYNSWDARTFDWYVDFILI